MRFFLMRVILYRVYPLFDFAIVVLFPVCFLPTCTNLLPKPLPYAVRGRSYPICKLPVFWMLLTFGLVALSGNAIIFLIPFPVNMYLHAIISPRFYNKKTKSEPKPTRLSLHSAHYPHNTCKKHQYSHADNHKQ